MNYSGNYNTSEREVELVKKLFGEYGVAYASVEKYSLPDDGDVLVTLKNGKHILIEVKEETYKRFREYGDLDIDYLSAFYFQKGVSVESWKGAPKRPAYHDDFLAVIDKQRPFKPGKLFYSKSDLWLFFVEAPDKSIYYHTFLDGKKVVDPAFQEFLKKNCLFAVNNKPYWQLSHSDDHQSATYFINHNNREITSRAVSLPDYVSAL